MALSWTILGGKELLAYAEGCRVTIFTSCGQEVSVLQLEDEVHCLSWCKKDGRLALGCQGAVHIYTPMPDSAHAPNEPMPTHSDTLWYKYKSTFGLAMAVSDEHESGAEPEQPAQGAPEAESKPVPTCIHWNVMGDRLAVGQGSLTLWEDAALRPPKRSEDTPSWRAEQEFTLPKPEHEDWEKVMERHFQGPICCATYGPDGRLVASVAEGAKQVQLWFLEVIQPVLDPGKNYEFIPNPTTRFATLPLRHPVPICSAEWLRKDLYKGYGSNVLMTLAADSVVRIWSESSMQETLTFHLSTVLTNDCSAGGVVRWLETPYNLAPQSNLLDYALELKKAEKEEWER